MIPAEAFGPGDFMMIRAELVRAVGGATEALIAAIIYWRAREGSPYAYERDGAWWWNASRQDMADATGLSVEQVRRAGSVLTESGSIAAAQHQLKGIQDRSFSYRVVTDTPICDPAQIDVGESTDVHVGESTNLPSPKKMNTNTQRARATRLPEGWVPSAAHNLLAQSLGVDVEFEADKFRDWCASDAVTKHDWEATFRNWLRRAQPRQRAVGGNAPRPSRDDEIRAWLAADDDVAQQMPGLGA